jgi:glycerol kinase
MVVNDWLCQFLADMIQLPVERPVNVETTALGAAVLASLGGGLSVDLSEAGRMWDLEREFLPIMAAAERERLLNGWRQAVERALLGA